MSMNNVSKYQCIELCCKTVVCMIEQLCSVCKTLTNVNVCVQI